MCVLMERSRLVVIDVSTTVTAFNMITTLTLCKITGVGVMTNYDPPMEEDPWVMFRRRKMNRGLISMKYTVIF